MQNVLEELAVQMRDPKRIDVVLGEVAKFWKAHPDLRFIQMMNAIDFSGRFTEFKKSIKDKRWMPVLRK